MKIPGISWLNTKYKFLLDDSAKKGIARTFSESIYEYRNKKKFRNLGVFHPDFVANIETTNEKSTNKDAHENQPSSFYSLNKAFSHLPVPANEISLLDIGCGSGRVLSFGMLLKFREVFGVDLDEPAIEKAIANCSRMQKKGYSTSFQISFEDACEYAIPKSVNVVFMFNPFGMKTMEKVAANIFQHAEKRNAALYFVYANPTCQEIFNKEPRCKRIFESFFKSGKPDIFIFQISPR